MIKTMRRNANPAQVLAIVCLGIVLANLDLFIVNVGLPNIAHDFQGAGIEQLSWVLNGYAIAYAALLVFFGRLAERYRRDQSFLLGVALFTAASVACAASGSVPTLVAFRVLQAAGAALMTPTSLGLLLASFPPERRSFAVRTWTAIGGFAAAFGPVVGGVLIGWSWRWIFLVNLPIGCVAMVAGAWALPSVPGHPGPRPSFGAALLVTIGIAAMIFAIIEVNEWGWRAPPIWGSALISVLALALFVRHCLRSSDPFVDPRLFAVRPFTGAALVMAPYSVGFGALLFSLAVWEQSGWGWSALQAGLAIAPGPLLVPFTSLLVAGRLIARFGPAPVIAAGVALFTAGFVMLATLVGTAPQVAPVLGSIVLTGLGVGLTYPTIMGVSAASLPSSAFATGSGVINMIRQAALAIGVAIFVAVIADGQTLAAFRVGWWIMAAIVAVSLWPALTLIGRRTV